MKVPALIEKLVEMGVMLHACDNAYDHHGSIFRINGNQVYATYVDDEDDDVSLYWIGEFAEIVLDTWLDTDQEDVFRTALAQEHRLLPSQIREISEEVKRFTREWHSTMADFEYRLDSAIESTIEGMITCKYTTHLTHHIQEEAEGLFRELYHKGLNV